MGSRRRKRAAAKGGPSSPPRRETAGQPNAEELLREEAEADAARAALLGQPAPELPLGPAGPEDLAAQTTTRRDFLSRAGSTAVIGCVLVATGGAVRLAVPDFFDGPPQRFALGTAADFKTGTLTWLPDRELFVLRDQGGFGAFSSRCTHLGCTVRRTAEGFFCPCHGARYDPWGLVVSGPARAPLPWYRLWIEADGRIFVDTKSIVPGGTITPMVPAGAAPDEKREAE